MATPTIVITTASDDNTREHNSSTIDHREVVIKAGHSFGVVCVGETSQSGRHLTSDTFKDREVALEGLMVLSSKLQIEVEK